MTDPVEGIQYLTHRAAPLLLPRPAPPPPDPWRNPALRLLIWAIQRQDPPLARHNRHVQRLALFLGASLQLPPQDLDLLSPAALFHDLGKTAISPSMLVRWPSTDRRVRDIIRAHPTLGADLCVDLHDLAPAAPIIETHHERLDGSGYPKGLSHRAIPLLTQVLQIADTVDALTSSTPTRLGYSLHAAIAVLFADADHHWRDPSLVRACADILTFTRIASPRTAFRASPYHAVVNELLTIATQTTAAPPDTLTVID